MSDTEALDLIQHYRWSLWPQDGIDVWCVENEDWSVFGKTVREAVLNAMAEQAKRAMAPKLEQ